MTDATPRPPPEVVELEGYANADFRDALTRSLLWRRHQLKEDGLIIDGRRWAVLAECRGVFTLYELIETPEPPLPFEPHPPLRKPQLAIVWCEGHFWRIGVRSMAVRGEE